MAFPAAAPHRLLRLLFPALALAALLFGAWHDRAAPTASDNAPARRAD